MPIDTPYRSGYLASPLCPHLLCLLSRLCAPHPSHPFSSYLRLYPPPPPHHHPLPSIPSDLPIELHTHPPTTSLHSPPIFVFFNLLHHPHKNPCKFPKHQLHLYTQPSFILMCPSKRQTIVRAKALPPPTTLYQRPSHSLRPCNGIRSLASLPL
jgi:hypothetical protein